ncbi:MAG: hypothetical protein ABSD68_00565 [Candidatus Micrarchaeales archaeon]
MVELVKGKSIDSFSDEVARTVSTMIADHSSSYRFIELIRNPDGRQVSIDIKGKFFNVEYSGELPQSSYLPYHRSNEKFDKHIFKVINAMHDIDGFKGIAGGFTFPLSLVLNMQCKNNLETLTFVDNDKSQLFHGIFVTLRYDKIFSESSKQFSQIPSRIDLKNQVTGRRYYTFLSTGGCKLLLDDLSTRSQPVLKEWVVTRRAWAEASRVLRGAKVKWFELRHFFRGSCEWAALHLPKRPLPSNAISFMLGNYVQGEVDLSPSNPKIVPMLRQGYSQVEKVCFT